MVFGPLKANSGVQREELQPFGEDVSELSLWIGVFPCPSGPSTVITTVIVFTIVIDGSVIITNPTMIIIKITKITTINVMMMIILLMSILVITIGRFCPHNWSLISAASSLRHRYGPRPCLVRGFGKSSASGVRG